MLIYTTDTFTGDQDALNTYTRERLPNQDAIAIGIDTVHRNLSIEAGTNVSLSDSQASDVVSAFQSNYDNGGDYTSATIAAIDSIHYTYNPNESPSPVIWIIFFTLMIGGIVLIERRGSSDSGSHGGHGGGGSHGGHGGGAGGHFGGGGHG
jgi:hypothetical protein